MPEPATPAPFDAKVRELSEVLTRSDIPHAFGGAIAYLYWGEPRATVGIDIKTTYEAWKRGMRKYA